MDIDEIIAANVEAGGHFFDNDTMKTFGTIVLPDVFESELHAHFVTSDNDHAGERHYKVRVFSKETKSVWTPYREGGVTFDDPFAAIKLAEELSEVIPG